jgi:hypothetical protein
VHSKRRLLPPALLALVACAGIYAQTQHNRLAISPPTAPPPPGTRMVSGEPVLPVSSGLGALQFVQVNYPVAAPQAITRQLESDDERTRQGSLSAIGVPNQYLNHGHVPMPHSIGLQFAQLSATDDLYALLTVELDNHIVTAVLAPDGSGWRRLATIVLPVPFLSSDGPDGYGALSTYLHLERSFQSPGHYRAVFRGVTQMGNGDFTENEAHLRVLNGRAMITNSFVSASRQCGAGPLSSSAAASGPPSGSGRPGGHPGCEILRRWTVTDPSAPGQRFNLVTATGHLNGREATDPMARTAPFRTAHLRQFSCQPFQYNEQQMHFEPTAPPAPCQVMGMREPPPR